MKKPEKIIVVAHPSKDHARMYRKDITRWLRDRGKRVVRSTAQQADLAIVLGGDGFMMSSVAEFSLRGIPSFGINAGDVGFLTSGDVEQWERILKKVLTGQYDIEERTTLELEYRGRQYGPFINDVVVFAERTIGKAMGIGHFSLSLNERLIYSSLGADGMIIATKTGSTAYSGSSGGHLLLPDSYDVIINPVNALAHAARPMGTGVLEQGGSIEIGLSHKSREAVLLQADSTAFPGLAPGERIIIRKHVTPALFATFGFDSFIAASQEKHKIPHL